MANDSAESRQLRVLSGERQAHHEVDLLAAQGRAEALSGANSAEAEEEGRAAFTSFLGTGNAYSPN